MNTITVLNVGEINYHKLELEFMIPGLIESYFNNDDYLLGNLILESVLNNDTNESVSESLQIYNQYYYRMRDTLCKRIEYFRVDFNIRILVKTHYIYEAEIKPNNDIYLRWEKK